MQLRHLNIITITHQRLSVEELGHFVIKTDEGDSIEKTLHGLKATFDIDEIIYLNTCNRVSFIMSRQSAVNDDLVEQVVKYINPTLSDSIIKRLPKFVDQYTGIKAIKHLYQVASSVDSLVIGEREIFRQFRQSYAFANEHNLCGDYMRLVEQATVNTAKYIYTYTKIGERPVSVASLSFKKMIEHEVDKDHKVLLIGTGETNTNVARFMKKQAFSNVSVFNRTLNNASTISELLDAPSYHLSDLEDYKEGFDCIVICTASTKPIIDLNLYKSLVGKDDRRKVIVDLSVPRNVDSQVIEQYDIEYIDVESIRQLAEQNMQFRKAEVEKAQDIIEERAENFESSLQIRRIEKALGGIPSEIKTIKQTAINSVFKKDLENLDSESKNLVLQMMDYMEKKCIAAPMKVAKKTIG